MRKKILHFAERYAILFLRHKQIPFQKIRTHFLVKMRSRFSRSYLLRRKVCVAASGDLRFSCAASRLRTFYFVRAVLFSPFDFFQIRRKTHDENTHKISPAADAPLHRSLCTGAHRLGRTKTGTCGDNLTYTLDTDTGVLAIAGSGKMTDWSVSMKLIKCHGITIEPQFAPCKSQKP